MQYIEQPEEIEYCPYCGSQELEIEGDAVKCVDCGKDFIIVAHD